MKKIFAGLFLTASFALASAQTINFDKTTFDYGTIKPGSEGHRSFVVKNTGDKPLIISKVQASCGCTTPEVPKDPIMPGKTAEIKVGYNTTINGPFQKLIEVYSNDPANSRSVIYIKGTVDANAPAPALAATEIKADTEVKALPVKRAAKKTMLKVSAK